eukprot:TRINITY_DN17467_c0_g1_i1.p1 TRINITY_DN17467_c0_g1~~TRINITY_DN17467_c0_g1_i1.p1  ORF type:complete len:352 (+),score=105.66 TRINITY_DN17467_c0_g1_i1:80-1057(+)
MGSDEDQEAPAAAPAEPAAAESAAPEPRTGSAVPAPPAPPQSKPTGAGAEEPAASAGAPMAAAAWPGAGRGGAGAAASAGWRAGSSWYSGPPTALDLRLDAWVHARVRGDLATADRIKAELAAKGVDVDKERSEAVKIASAERLSERIYSARHASEQQRLRHPGHPGNWTCNCGVRNKAELDVCWKCHSERERPEFSGGAAASDGGFAMAAGQLRMLPGASGAPPKRGEWFNPSLPGHGAATGCYPKRVEQVRAVQRAIHEERFFGQKLSGEDIEGEVPLAPLAEPVDPAELPEAKRLKAGPVAAADDGAEAQSSSGGQGADFAD